MLGLIKFINDKYFTALRSCSSLFNKVVEFVGMWCFYVG